MGWEEGERVRGGKGGQERKCEGLGETEEGRKRGKKRIRGMKKKRGKAAKKRE